MGEALSEPGEFGEGLVARGRLLLTLTPPADAADTHRPLAESLVLQPLISLQAGHLHPNTRLEVRGWGLSDGGTVRGSIMGLLENCGRIRFMHGTL